MSQKVDPTQMNVKAQSVTGKNGAYTRIGDIVICYGYNAVAYAGTTINLPYTYSSAPSVIQATTQDPNNWPAWVVNSTPSTIHIKQAYTATPLNVHWLVIGPA